MPLLVVIEKLLTHKALDGGYIGYKECHFLIRSQISDIGIDLISIHPIYTQANIMNRKKLNTTTNINTAKVATNRANILSIVTII
jgi:hypothetical protein